MAERRQCGRRRRGQHARRQTAARLGPSHSSTRSAHKPTRLKPRRRPDPLGKHDACARRATSAVSASRHPRIRPPRTSSEARGRRPALRPGHQRRRRAARALHRRASRASCRGRGADDLRHRLRHVAQRAARRRRDASTTSRCAASASSTSAIRSRSAGCPSASSTSRTRSPTNSTWLDAEGPTSPALIAHIARHAAELRLLHLLQLSLLPRVSRRPGGRPRAPSWCRRPNATRRSACRSSRRSSGACARSCTTRRKSAR